MGIWDYIPSTDSLKSYTPDLTSIKRLCWSSYGYSRTTAGKAVNALRVNAVEKLSKNLSDEETRSNMTQIASKIAKNAAVYACREGLKTIPGGWSVYNIVSSSIRDGNNGKGHSEIKALEAELNIVKNDLSECKRLLNQVALQNSNVESPNDICIKEKPEDLIRLFMMTEFIGRDFMDNLIVPGVRSRTKPHVEGNERYVERFQY